MGWEVHDDNRVYIGPLELVHESTRTDLHLIHVEINGTRVKMFISTDGFIPELAVETYSHVLCGTGPHFYAVTNAPFVFKEEGLFYFSPIVSIGRNWFGYTQDVAGDCLGDQRNELFGERILIDPQPVWAEPFEVGFYNVVRLPMP